jgi:hypothetical protein
MNLLIVFSSWIRIWIRISNANKDPADKNQCGSLWIRIHNTDKCVRIGPSGRYSRYGICFPWGGGNLTVSLFLSKVTKF